MAPVVSVGQILLQSSRTRDLRCKLGENPPMPVSPYSKIALIDRPRNLSLVDWQGREPLAIRVDLIADAWDDRSDSEAIEARFHRLEKMAGLDDDPTEPPIVSWFANSPHDASKVDRPWIIESLEFTRIWYQGQAQVDMVRWSATIVLRHYVADEFAERNHKGIKKVKKKTKAEKRKARKRKRPLIGKVISSDKSLAHFSARVLNDADQWREVAALNGIRDPRNIKEGQELRLP